MKNFFLKISVLFLALSFVYSCEKEDATIESGSTFSSIEDVLTTMKAKAVKEEKPIIFDLGLQKGIYDISNIEVVENFEEQFELAFNKLNGVQVDCAIGDEISSTSCPDGEGQGLCVGAAVKSCLDAGGCATACSVRVTITP